MDRIEKFEQPNYRNEQSLEIDYEGEQVLRVSASFLKRGWG